MRVGRRLTGNVTTRVGVVVSGYKTKYDVDPGLQDTIVPIALAHMNALCGGRAASVYASHHSGTQPIPALPDSLKYLSQGDGGRRRLLPEQSY